MCTLHFSFNAQILPTLSTSLSRKNYIKKLKAPSVVMYVWLCKKASLALSFILLEPESFPFLYRQNFPWFCFASFLLISFEVTERYEDRKRHSAGKGGGAQGGRYEVCRCIRRRA
jgi:hypothetical protein